MKTFAERVKELRTAARMSQKDLASAVGVSQNAVSNWEGGLRKAPRGETVIRLAAVLKVDVEALYRDGPVPEAPFPSDHKRLLDAFDRLSARNKSLVQQLIRALQ